MTAELRCNAVVPDPLHQDNRCRNLFVIPDLLTVAEARQLAAQRGWRTRKSPSQKFPVLDRCPDHAKLRDTR